MVQARVRFALVFAIEFTSLARSCLISSDLEMPLSWASCVAAMASSAFIFMTTWMNLTPPSGSDGVEPETPFTCLGTTTVYTGHYGVNGDHGLYCGCRASHFRQRFVVV
jgi:hypothetical protein